MRRLYVRDKDKQQEYRADVIVTTIYHDVPIDAFSEEDVKEQIAECKYNFDESDFKTDRFVSADVSSVKAISPIKASNVYRVSVWDIHYMKLDLECDTTDWPTEASFKFISTSRVIEKKAVKEALINYLVEHKDMYDDEFDVCDFNFGYDNYYEQEDF